jgi:hypothetical protein
MVAVIVRSDIAAELEPGLNKVFGLEYKSVDNEHTNLFEMETSDRAFEEEVIFSLFGTAPIKNEGASVEFDTAQESWKARYTHATVALAFAVTEEAMEDNLYDTFAKVRAKALGRAMANTKQVICANVFNNGFSASYLGGDAVALFSASHPTTHDGNQSNTVSADLSETTLETAMITISLFEDDRGILIGSMANSLHIPPQLQFVAERILHSTGRVGTADNDINALRSTGMLPGGYHVNRRFTDTNGFFIQTDVPNGTKFFTRKPVQTKMHEDFLTGNLMYKTRERYSVGWSNWRRWYGSNGSS